MCFHGGSVEAGVFLGVQGRGVAAFSVGGKLGAFFRPFVVFGLCWVSFG